MGGDLPADRAEVCSALSLALPLLKRGKKVHIKLKSTALIPLFHSAVLQYDLQGSSWGISYDATPAQLQECFGAKYSDYLAPVTGEYITVDMVSGRMPSFTKTEDIDEKWASLFPAGLPKAPYIAIAKVPPSVAKDYNVFYFNSAHAFDFAVSSEPTILVAQAEVEVLPAEVRLKYSEEERTKLTSHLMLQRQYADDRRKLSYYLEFEGPRYDPRMNLWIPEPKLVKSQQDLLVPELVQGASYLTVASFGQAVSAPAPAPAQAVVLAPPPEVHIPLGMFT